MLEKIAAGTGLLLQKVGESVSNASHHSSTVLTCLRSTDIPDPPQCEQLLDCTWAEQGDGGHADQYEPLCQNVTVETALEATEFTVHAMESENRQGSLSRDKSNQEGCVAIEMSAQPLLELVPMTGIIQCDSSCIMSTDTLT